MVDEELLIKRLTGRRVCKNCGATFHVITIPPKEEGICDICGEPLIQRADDTEETAVNRLKVYEEQTSPLVAYYEEKELLAPIDGEGTPDEVFQNILEVLGE